MNFTAEQYQKSENTLTTSFTTELKKGFDLEFMDSFSQNDYVGITFRGTELECLRCYFNNRTYKKVILEDLKNGLFLLSFYEVFTEEQIRDFAPLM